MAVYVTTAMKNNILGYLFGNRTFENPVSLWLGLSKTPINADGTGVTEPSILNTGYKRILITNDNTTFAVPQNGTVTNAIQLQFEEFKIDLGTATHWFLATQEIGGEILYVGKLNPTRNMELSSFLIIPIDRLKFDFIDGD